MAAVGVVSMLSDCMVSETVKCKRPIGEPAHLAGPTEATIRKETLNMFVKSSRNRAIAIGFLIAAVLITSCRNAGFRDPIAKFQSAVFNVNYISIDDN
jgi:hypothetical protein